MAGSNALRFSDQLDTVFLITGEMIENCGEDNYCCMSGPNSAMVSVFDGCGGLGSRTYPGFKGHTGAYMASRFVSGAIRDWYRSNHKKRWHNPNEMLESLNRCLTEAYAVGTQYASSNLKIRGSMVRDFPTTAAIALAQQDGDSVLLHVIWAGDSRVYLMDARGLAQLTKDDVDTEDALSNLFEDGTLTNVLSSDGRYTLHHKHIRISGPTVVFAATDGCFGYIPSPMEFEYTLLHTMLQAKTPAEFKKLLKSSIHNVTGDDFALGYMSFFYGDFLAMQDAYRNRLTYLENNYVNALRQDHSEAVTRRLWNSYRGEYERFL